MPKGLKRTLNRRAVRQAGFVSERIVLDDVRFTLDTDLRGSGVKVLDMPEGLRFQVLGALLKCNFTALTSVGVGIVADWNGDFGLGWLVNENATLSNSEKAFISTTPTQQAVAGASTGNRGSSADASNSYTVKNVVGAGYGLAINLLVDTGDLTAANEVEFALDGTLDINYLILPTH